MHVEFYEKIWMWAAAALLVLFVGILVLSAVSQAIHPPSHVETIDPQTLSTNADFQPGVALQPDGGATVMRGRRTMRVMRAGTSSVGIDGR